MGVGRYALLFLLMVSIVSAADASLFDTAVDSVTTFFDWVMGGITGLAIDDGLRASFSFCGTVNGNLLLTSNISSSGTCLTVNASNIVIDCNGYSIIGDGTGDGVYISAFDNVTIQNCRVENYTRSINTATINISVYNNTFYDDLTINHAGSTIVNNAFVNSSVSLGFVKWDSDVYNNTFSMASTGLYIGDAYPFVSVSVYDNTFVNHSDYAVDVRDSNNTKIFRNEFNSSVVGLYIRNSDQNNVSNNIFSNCTGGISTLASDSNIIQSNSFSGGSDQIYGVNNNNNSVLFNTLYGASGLGIHLLSGANNSVESNVVNQSGVQVTSVNSVIVNNTVWNAVNGVRVLGDYGLVINNTLINNFDGIEVDTAHNVTVSYNNVFNSSLVGIRCEDSNNMNVTGNNVTGNDDGSELRDCYNALFTGNNISNNTLGISAQLGINIVHVYNNYFDNVNKDIYNYNLSSTFNTTNISGPNIIGGPYIGGNFYASYAGVDIDGDGFGDTPFNDSGNMAVPDFLPLVLPSPSGCGYVNSDVTLTNNVSANGTCFTVNTSNVVIDCNGYSITGNGTLYGVHSAGHGNVTVQNCVIFDYVKATFLTGGSDHMVRDNTLFELDRGVDIVGGVNHVVVNNSIFNTTYALHVVTNNSDIVNNTLFNNSEYGLRLFNSDTILVDGNEFIMNTQGGIHLDNSENTVTSNNIFRDNLHRGINVYGFATHTITGNNITGSIRGILGQTGAMVYNNYFNNTIDINSSQLTARHNTTKILGTNIIGGPYLGGNFYASYAGVDNDGDGIGDIPFNDSGNMAVPDYLPLMYGGSAVSCGYVNSDLTLTNNVSANGTCFTVNASDIVIDCNGYSISGNGTGDAVNMTSYDNVTIRNCWMVNYSRSLYVLSGNISLYNNTFDNDVYVSNSGSTVDNNTFANSTFTIYQPSWASDVYNNSFIDAVTGLYVRYAYNLNVSVYDNTFNSNSLRSVWLRESNGTNVFRNQISNSPKCVDIDFGNDINITNNVLINCTNRAISFTDSNLMVIINNTVFDSAIGLYVDGNNNSVFDNNVSGALSVAIKVAGGANNTVNNNTLMNSTEGIELGSSYNNVSGNTIRNSAMDGIEILDPFNTVTDNSLLNSTFGIELSSANNVTVLNNMIQNSSQEGVRCISSNNMTVTGNNISGSTWGVDLYNCHNTLLSSNNISANTYGVDGGSSIMHAYNNYFNNSNYDVSNSNLSSTFNTTKIPETNIIGGSYMGGNFYASYAGIDSDGDEIGDTPFNDNGNMTVADYLPLMHPTVSCGSVDSNLNLTHNLSSSGTCFTANASNIVIDCKGYSITGDGTGYGIFTNSSSNVTVRNCEISHFANAVQALTGGRTYIINNTLHSSTAGAAVQLAYATIVNNTMYNVTYGVNTNMAYSSNITNNIVYNTTTAVYFMNTDDSVISDNIIYNSTDGIYLSLSSNNNTVYANTVINNSGSGIKLQSSSNSSVYNNTLTANAYGVYALNTALNNSIYGNTIVDHSDSGVRIEMSTDNRVFNNSLSNNSWGVYLRNTAVNSSIYGNTIIDHAHMGVWIFNSDDNTFYNNILVNNTDGVYLDNAANISIYGNTITNHSNNGLYLDTSQDNTVSNNTMTNNTVGVYETLCDGSYYYNNTISGSTAMNLSQSTNSYIYYSNLTADLNGVELDGENITVQQNTITNSNVAILSTAANVTVRNNTLSDNDVGLSVDAYGYHNITLNNMSGNVIGINSTSILQVYNNYFNNTLDINNSNTSSRFNTTQTAGMNIIGGPNIGGNFYASYNGTDTNGDGFGETPYNASGNMSVNDFLPLVPGAVYVPPTPSSDSSSGSSGGGGGGGGSSRSSGSSGPVLTYLGDSSGSTTESSSATESGTVDTTTSDTSTSESSAESSTESSDSSSESSRTESTDTSIDRYAAPSIATASLNAVRGMMAPVISTMKTNSILFQLVGAVALFSSILGIAHVVTRPTPVAVPVAKQVELQTVPVFIGKTYMLSHETRLRMGKGEDVYVDYDIILDVHDHEHIYRRRFK